MDDEMVGTSKNESDTKNLDDVENDSLSSYYPDFSDIYDEKDDFWDFLNTKDNVKRTSFNEQKQYWDGAVNLEIAGSTNDFEEAGKVFELSDYVRNCNTESRRNTENELQTIDDDPMLASCKFWDFLSSDGTHNQKNKSCDFKPHLSFGQSVNYPSEEVAGTSRAVNCKVVHQFEHSEQNNHYYQSQFQVHMPVKQCVGERTSFGPQNVENRQINDTCTTDSFWDFLKTTPSTDYTEVLNDVISSTVTSPLSIVPDTGLLSSDESPFCTVPSKSASQSRSSEIYTNPNQNVSKRNSTNSLPCISSVFSIKPYPKQNNYCGAGSQNATCQYREISRNILFRQPTAVNEKKVSKTLNNKTSSEMNVNSAQNSSTLEVSANKSKPSRNNKCLLRENQTVCSHFVCSDTGSVTNVMKQPNSLKKEINRSTNLKAQNNHLNAQNNTINSGEKTSLANQNEISKSLPITVEKVGMSNNSNNGSTPLCLFLQNPETLQNPNYSHFFVIVNNNNNNNVDVQKSISSNRKEILSTSNCSNGTNVSINKQNVLCIPNSNQNSNKGQNQLSGNINIQNGIRSNFEQSKINEGSSLEKRDPSINTPNSLNKDAVLSEFRNKHILSSSRQKKGVELNQNFSDLLSNSSNVSNSKCNIPVSSRPFNDEYSHLILENSKPNLSSNHQSNTLSTDKLNLTDIEKTSLQTISRITKDKNVRPIKNLPLGKHKNAIQQMSTLQRINLDLESETNNSKRSSSNIPSDSTEKVVLGISAKIPPENLNSFPMKHFKYSSTSSSNTLNKTIQTEASNISKPIHIVMDINLPGSQMAKTDSISATSGQKAKLTVPSSSTSTISVTNANQTALNANLTLFNSLKNLNNSGSVLQTTQQNQQTGTNSAHKSTLATMQELFPPPISMVPVCVLPSSSSLSQSILPKVLILQDTNQKKIQPKLQPNLQKSSIMVDRKISPKIKKPRKTVKQLLEEHHQKSKNVEKAEPQITRREIRVLRPLCKIPCTTTSERKLSPKVTTITSSNSSTNIVNLGVYNNNAQNTISNKRPNIMVLPSASKLKEDQNLLKNQKPQSEPFVLDVTPIDLPTQSSFKSLNSIDKPRRPRHYDMSELQIGYFKVEDVVDSCGRFRSKFKVLFTKRQFYYDFPVSRCNQGELKTSHIWEQMARIAVPFKTLTFMSLKDRMIHLNVNATPHIFLGTIQARSGMLSNATVFDTPVEGDSSWGDCIRNSFNHKVVLRKRQASKLKTFLCQFDKRFIFLTSTTACGNQSRNVKDSFLFGSELSPNSLKKSLAKSRKSFIRRLPQWDHETEEEHEQQQQKVSNDEDLLINQICSCRTNCRSVRCSCVKAAKSCTFSGSVCQCLNCNNPLNVLESLGMNTEFSLSDSCLFQNIYQIPDLLSYLQGEIRLECCNSFARVQDCIPGTVLCPNINCNAHIEYSWCQKMISYPERNPRNHCSFCGQCCFSNGRHCYTCKRCYVVSSKSVNCPTCQKKSDAYSSEKVCVTASKQLNSIVYENKITSRPTFKPEIIVLDSSRLSKNYEASQCQAGEFINENTASGKIINYESHIQNCTSMTENNIKDKNISENFSDMETQDEYTIIEDSFEIKDECD